MIPLSSRASRGICFSALLIAACSANAPRAIAYDADACEQCHMQVSDPRFGGEIQTRTGKLYVFDAIECLLDYERAARAKGDVGSVWVIDFRSPKTFVVADSAWFVAAPGGRTPMGRGLYATATQAGAQEIRANVGGEIKRWSEIQ
jgi:copper chaperone NosL